MSTDVKAFAKKAVKSIVADLTDRRGLRQEWNAIDADIRKEIVASWEGLVAKAFAPPPAKR